MSHVSPEIATAPGCSSQTFIYPIRSAVSLRPNQELERRPSTVSTASSSTADVVTAILSETIAPKPSHICVDTSSSCGYEDVKSPAHAAESVTYEDESVDNDDVFAELESKRSEIGLRGEGSIGAPRKPLNGPDTGATEAFDAEEKETTEKMTHTSFKHVETEEGHMVLTGRDGVLLRCEDEVSRPQ